MNMVVHQTGTIVCHASAIIVCPSSVCCWRQNLKLSFSIPLHISNVALHLTRPLYSLRCVPHPLYSLRCAFTSSIIFTPMCIYLTHYIHWGVYLIHYIHSDVHLPHSLYSLWCAFTSPIIFTQMSIYLTHYFFIIFFYCCSTHTYHTGSELGASGLLRECNHTCTLIKRRHIKHRVIYNTINT